jgi:hypothetical protein
MEAFCASLPTRALASTRICFAIVTLALIAALTLASWPAQATVAIAQKTGKGCNICHTTPPALNPTGEKYKATGKLPPSDRP